MTWIYAHFCSLGYLVDQLLRARAPSKSQSSCHAVLVRLTRQSFAQLPADHQSDLDFSKDREPRSLTLQNDAYMRLSDTPRSSKFILKAATIKSKISATLP